MKQESNPRRTERSGTRLCVCMWVCVLGSEHLCFFFHIQYRSVSKTDCMLAFFFFTFTFFFYSENVLKAPDSFEIERYFI